MGSTSSRFNKLHSWITNNEKSLKPWATFLTVVVGIFAILQFVFGVENLFNIVTPVKSSQAQVERDVIIDEILIALSRDASAASGVSLELELQQMRKDIRVLVENLEALNIIPNASTTPYRELRSGNVAAAKAILHAEIEKGEESVISLAEMYYNLSTLDYYANPEDALAYIDRSLSLMPDNYNILIRRGLIQKRLGNLDDAEASYHEAGQLALKAQDSVALFKAHLLLGILYSSPEKAGLALKNSQLALEYAKALEDRERISLALNVIGGNYFQLKKYNEGKAAIEEAIQISMELGHMDFLASNYLNLAMLHLHIKEHGKAEVALDKAYEITQQYNLSDPNKLSRMMELYGKLHTAKKEYAKAIEYLNIAKNDYEKINNTDAQIRVYELLTYAYIGIQDIDNAESSVLHAIEVSREWGDQKDIERMEGRYEMVQWLKQGSADVTDGYRIMYTIEGL